MDGDDLTSVEVATIWGTPSNRVENFTRRPGLLLTRFDSVEKCELPIGGERRHM